MSVTLRGAIGGMSVKPNKDGGLDGTISLHFGVDSETTEGIAELMSRIVEVRIDAPQTSLFIGRAVDPATGEIAEITADVDDAERPF